MIHKPPVLIASLSRAARTLRAQFEETGLFGHAVSKGAERERLIADLLKARLPGHVNVFHNAEIISADGTRSAQCDIVLADRSTPPLLDTGTNRLIPAECVYAVIEVKSGLDGKELAGACENIKKAKALPKSAFLPDERNRTHGAYGKTYGHVPTIGMIFAFSGSSLDVLGDHFGNWVGPQDIAEVPDSLWVLGSGWINWKDEDNKLRTTAQPSRIFGSFSPYGESDVLASFLLQLNVLLTAAWMPPLDLLAYAGTYPLGVAERNWTPNPQPEEALPES